MLNRTTLLTIDDFCVAAALHNEFYFADQLLKEWNLQSKSFKTAEGNRDKILLQVHSLDF